MSPFQLLVEMLSHMGSWVFKYNIIDKNSTNIKEKLFVLERRNSIPIGALITRIVLLSLVRTSNDIKRYTCSN